MLRKILFTTVFVFCGLSSSGNVLSSADKLNWRIEARILNKEFKQFEADRERFRADREQYNVDSKIHNESFSAIFNVKEGARLRAEFVRLFNEKLRLEAEARRLLAKRTRLTSIAEELNEQRKKLKQPVYASHPSVI